MICFGGVPPIETPPSMCLFDGKSDPRPPDGASRGQNLYRATALHIPIGADRQLLAEIKRDMEIECVGSMACHLDPLKSGPKGLGLTTMPSRKLLLRGAVENHHVCIGRDFATSSTCCTFFKIDDVVRVPPW